jgi:hypothetical protein
MGVKIDDTEMRSEATGHTAKRQPSGKWRASWLPEYDLDRNEAVTAMVLAEHVGHRSCTELDKTWPHITGWAAELGMGPEAALLGIRQPPPARQAEEPGICGQPGERDGNCGLMPDHEGRVLRPRGAESHPQRQA